MASGRATLQAYFLTGEMPTQEQFAALIASYLNLVDDVIEIDLSAGDISGDGAETPYTVDLSGYGLPAFPKAFMLYVSLTGDWTSDSKWINTPDYDPLLQVLEGVASPDQESGYPDQLMKIIVF